MILKGRVWKFGDNIDTDLIIPGRYLTSHDPNELARHCMEGIDPDFPAKVKSGDIVVAGENFGCGSSREHAPLCMKQAGIQAVVAASFARIFFRNSINIGLALVECRDAYERVSEGDEILLDLERGLVSNLTSGEQYVTQAYPPLVSGIVAAGGLVGYVRKRLKELK